VARCMHRARVPSAPTDAPQTRTDRSLTPGIQRRPPTSPALSHRLRVLASLARRWISSRRWRAPRSTPRSGRGVPRRRRPTPAGHRRRPLAARPSPTTSPLASRAIRRSRSGSPRRPGGAFLPFLDGCEGEGVGGSERAQCRPDRRLRLRCPASQPRPPVMAQVRDAPGGSAHPPQPLSRRLPVVPDGRRSQRPRRDPCVRPRPQLQLKLGSSTPSDPKAHSSLARAPLCSLSVCVREATEVMLVKPRFPDLFEYLVLEVADSEVRQIRRSEAYPLRLRADPRPSATLLTRSAPTPL
jgi:hypothetical protein